MVVTNSYLTKPARKFGNSVGCVVVDRDVLGNWISRFQSGGAVSTPRSEAQYLKSPPAPSESRTVSAEAFDRKSAGKPFEPGRDGVPPEVFRKIKSYASKQCPGDRAAQGMEIEEGVSSYLQLMAIECDGMPKETFDKILRQVAREHSSDFHRQLIYAGEQFDAFTPLRDFDCAPMPKETFEKVFKKIERVQARFPAPPYLFAGGNQRI
jgi:hypothetical protein